MEKEVKKLTKWEVARKFDRDFFDGDREDMVMVDIIIMKGFGQKQSLILKTIGT